MTSLPPQLRSVQKSGWRSGTPSHTSVLLLDDHARRVNVLGEDVYLERAERLSRKREDALAEGSTGGSLDHELEAPLTRERQRLEDLRVHAGNQALLGRPE